ncbi:MAG TPA: hypothetical protein EYP14_16190, partial [Planctomycetaceae bacterium]|nr:hypothetical protein [Planctomycetaceae bacterium]
MRRHTDSRWRVGLASVLGLLALAGGRSIADRRDSETGPIFRYERPIRFAGTDEAIVAVLLDSEVYAATQEGFADVLISNGKIEEITGKSDGHTPDGY